mgnify:CR=1 FL=1
MKVEGEHPTLTECPSHISEFIFLLNLLVCIVCVLLVACESTYRCKNASLCYKILRHFCAIVSDPELARNA